MKKEIKINFVDFCEGFDKQNNLIVNLLSKHYRLLFAEQPDFLFCSCFGSDHKKYTGCVKIFDTLENVLPDFNLYDYGAGFDYLEFGDRYFHKNYYHKKKTVYL